MPVARPLPEPRTARVPRLEKSGPIPARTLAPDLNEVIRDSVWTPNLSRHTRRLDGTRDCDTVLASGLEWGRELRVPGYPASKKQSGKTNRREDGLSEERTMSVFRRRRSRPSFIHNETR